MRRTSRPWGAGSPYPEPGMTAHVTGPHCPTGLWGLGLLSTWALPMAPLTFSCGPSMQKWEREEGGPSRA